MIYHDFILNYLRTFRIDINPKSIGSKCNVYMCKSPQKMFKIVLFPVRQPNTKRRYDCLIILYVRWIWNKLFYKLMFSRRSFEVNSNPTFSSSVPLPKLTPKQNTLFSGKYIILY